MLPEAGAELALLERGGTLAEQETGTVFLFFWQLGSVGALHSFGLFFAVYFDIYTLRFNSKSLPNYICCPFLQRGLIVRSFVGCTKHIWLFLTRNIAPSSELAEWNISFLPASCQDLDPSRGNNRALALIELRRCSFILWWLMASIRLKSTTRQI